MKFQPIKEISIRPFSKWYQQKDYKWNAPNVQDFEYCKKTMDELNSFVLKLLQHGYWLRVVLALIVIVFLLPNCVFSIVYTMCTWVCRFTLLKKNELLIIIKKGTKKQTAYTLMTLLSLLQVTWNHVHGLTRVGSQLCRTLLGSNKLILRLCKASPVSSCKRT